MHMLATSAPPRSVQAILGGDDAPQKPRPLKLYHEERASSRGTGCAQDDGTKVVIPAHIGNSVDSLEYVVTVGFGITVVVSAAWVLKKRAFIFLFFECPFSCESASPTSRL